MVKAISDETTFVLAGVKVSQTTLQFVFEITPEIQDLLKSAGHKTGKKYLVYWESPWPVNVSGDKEPFFGEIRFEWLAKCAKLASRLWWTDYIKYPATAEDCLPDGVPVSDIFVLQV